MFRLCPIASGSSGNCTFIEAGDTRLLVDAGISGKKVIEGLTTIDIDPSTINAIFITHEHIDHIKGVGIYSRKFNVPIYTTHKTWDKMIDDKSLGKLKEENIFRIEKNAPMNIGELTITPYPIPHDAVDPVGYKFDYNGKRIIVTTDLGEIDDEMMENLKGVNGILLEFNHDINMLKAGGYPYALKQRILGRNGHLNNDDAARVLANIYHKDLNWAVLGHLSQDNNVPELAYLTAVQALKEKNIEIGEDIEVYVAKRHEVSKMFEVK